MPPMRVDANKISFRALRNILDAAQPLETEVAGTRVACSVARAAQPKWPRNGVEG